MEPITKFKRIARNGLERSCAGRKLLNYRRALAFVPYLERVGWLASARQSMPVDQAGEPLPWFTFPAIHFLKDRIPQGMHVFEYGSGNSTLWWSDKVASIVACEHNREWFAQLRPHMPPNVDYRFCELQSGGDYCRLVTTIGSQFDCIVIDGRDRVNCARHAVGSLTPSGVIIWDNSDRQRYAGGYEFLLQRGFRRLDFHGIGAINADEWCTSIFYRPDNCFGI